MSAVRVAVRVRDELVRRLSALRDVSVVFRECRSGGVLFVLVVLLDWVGWSELVMRVGAELYLGLLIVGLM